MTTKDYFHSVRRIDNEIDALIEARAKLYEQCTKVTATMTSMPKSISPPHKYDKLVEMDDMIDKKIREAVVLKYDVLSIISKLDDKVERAVMLNFYINGLSFEEIAEKMSYSVKSVIRKRNEALKKIVI